MGIKILGIENTRRIPETACARLKDYGYQVTVVSRDHYHRNSENFTSYDLALYMCDRHEDEFPRSIHPILFILEQSSLPKTMTDFHIGREDYITEPIDPAELLMRVQMLLRCSGADVSRKLVIGTLEVDLISREATVKGETIPLTTREFNLLYGLLSSPNKAFSRQELMREYWAEDSSTSRRAVDVYMTKLREKFSACEDFQIVTVHGVGYKAVQKQ